MFSCLHQRTNQLDGAEFLEASDFLLFGDNEKNVFSCVSV